MAVVPLTDLQIAVLLRMPKQVVNPGAKTREQKSSEAVNYDVVGEDGSRFRLYSRQNMRVPEAFSCGLLYLPGVGDPLTLTRYNGSDHRHSNPLDPASSGFLDFHIHIATERYMAAGRKAEHFAAPTDRYTTLAGALRSLLLDCNIGGLEQPDDDFQMDLL